MIQKNYYYFIIGLAFIFTACSNGSGSNWTTLKFKQTQPIICHHPTNDSVDTHGDIHYTEANLMDSTGKVVGQAIGYHVMVDNAGKDGMGREDMDERMTTMVCRFNEKDALMVVGGLIFNPGETLIVENQENYRAIVGGTGKYKGARGQSIVTAKKDGTIEVLLEFKLD